MRALLFVLLLPSAASAACPNTSEPVLSCTTRGATRVLDVCLTGDTITYAYGAPGQSPDLALSAPITDVESQPWPGIGRAIWESVTFANGEHRYEVAFGVDRIAKGEEILPDPYGAVTVWHEGSELVTISCDMGSAYVGLWVISDAKEARDICWAPEAQIWANCSVD